MKLTAGQHVSAMLTSRQSPRGQGGYQTLFYTHERLAPDELSMIERQVQYSSAGDSRAKWQSYRLTDQRHVISRIVPIPEPDDFGRRGRYFTHSLICDVPGEQFDAALFGLLRPQNFLSSLARVLASDGMRTGRAPAVVVEVGDGQGGGESCCLRDWTGDQLNLLYMLMSDPRHLTEQGRHVALVGSEGQILEALKAAFLLTPGASRKFCSFDTNPSGSASPPSGAFWGRGSVAAGESGYVIDAARRQVTLPESSPLRAGGFSPERVSTPLREAVIARLTRPSEEMLRSLAGRKYAAFIGEPLYQSLLHETGLPLTADELKMLEPFGRAHGGLGLLLTLRSGDDARRLRALAAMDARTYRERVAQLRTHPEFKPWQAFSPVFTPTWFELFRGAYRLDDLTTAVAKVAEHGSEQDRRHVETIPQYLEPAERRALGRWLKASPFQLGRLQDALDKPVRSKADSGKSPSFLRRMLHPFGE